MKEVVILFNPYIMLTLLLANICFAEQGVLDDKIKLGMSNALTGPTSQLGLKLRKGSQVYFDKINNLGGIYGRRIELISYDDGYEPENTVRNTRLLIEQEQVFALFGYVGTPTSHAILSIIKQKETPYLMPFTGADFLRSPQIKNVFNLRASYLQEAKAQIKYLIENQNLKHFALVIQADEFGLAAQRSYVKALSHYNLIPVVNERFKRNSSDISKVLEKLKTKSVDAVLFVGTYLPFSRLINLAHQQNIKPYFSSLSFVSSADVFARLDYPSKVIISEVMPEPNTCQVSFCQQFLADMNKAGVEQTDGIQFEGYFNAYVLTNVIRQCGKNLTRSCLLKKLSNLSFDKSLNLRYLAKGEKASQVTFLSFSPLLKQQAKKL